MTTAPITREEIGARDRQLTRTTRRRNAFEYLAGGAAMLFFLVMAVWTFAKGGSAAQMLIAVGFAVLALGVAVAGWHLFRQSRRAAAGGGIAADAGYLEGRLARERDLLRSAWLWYAGPMVPGFALIYGGVFLSGGVAFATIAGGLTLAFLILVAVINRRAAACIDREIADLRHRRT
ncbi:hypothetical protein [Paenirhodobacter populi]|uniref:Uncharacterized protein n=1 Tax=Paenirhodobacter populi TaxID=2306993 RepID=A0A443JHR2_9RHOB|nr:hypothetical protein [Sinirhodobacter populi]RWR20119.1 hypothetical protein D2T30_11805 [Sinirhodobacter populi]